MPHDSRSSANRFRGGEDRSARRPSGQGGGSAASATSPYRLEMPDDLDPFTRQLIEELFSQLSYADLVRAGPCLQATLLPSGEFVFHYPDSPDSGQECGDSGSGRSVPAEDSADMLDDALRQDLDPEECGRLERRIRERIGARERDCRRAIEDALARGQAGAEDDPGADPMRSIGDYFAQAGDYLRLGILSQKRPTRAKGFRDRKPGPRT